MHEYLYSQCDTQGLLYARFMMCRVVSYDTWHRMTESALQNMQLCIATTSLKCELHLCRVKRKAQRYWATARAMQFWSFCSHKGEGLVNSSRLMFADSM